MSRWDSTYLEFESLAGKTFTAVEVGDDTITFTANDGSQYQLRHEQDCCEHVYVESVVGDVNDLIGSPIVRAEEARDRDMGRISDYDESYTWTFYKLATRKGYVDIRFYGSSNGYYGEDVDLILLRGPNK